MAYTTEIKRKARTEKRCDHCHGKISKGNNYYVVRWHDIGRSERGQGARLPENICDCCHTKEE